MNRSKLILAILLLLAASQAKGKISPTDSLLRKVYTASGDEAQLSAILALCAQNDIHIDTFEKYAVLGYNLAQHTADKVKKAYAAYYLAYLLYYSNNNDSARTTIDAALERLPVKNKEEKKIYYKLKCFRATTYQGQRRNEEALQLLYPLLNEAEKNDEPLFVAQIMHQIAVIEGQQTNPQKLIAWEQKALDILPRDESNADIILATIYATLGKAYLQMNYLDSATYFHLKAIDIFRKENDPYNLAVVLQRQVNVFIGKKQPQQVREILDELSALNEKIKMGEGDVNFYMSFINYYLLTGNYDQAIEMCKEHLYSKKASGNESIRLTYLKALADAYKAKQDWKLYATTVDEWMAAKDSYYKSNSAEAIAEMETKYEVQKKENLIIQQKYDIAKKNILSYGSLILLMLGGIIAWLFFRNYNRKNNMKLFMMQEEEKRNALLAVKEAEENERKRIAADLHDSLGSYAASIKANADEMMYTEHIAAQNLELLQTNSQQMVSLLGDTIWALRKESLNLSDISDRIKNFLQRLRPNYPKMEMYVEEAIDKDIALHPNHAYHLFMIVQEAVNNALKHSGGNEVIVTVTSKDKWGVTISDNGKGMTHSAPSPGDGNGRYNMRSRAENMGCSIEWNARSSGGTVVLIMPNTF